MKSLVFVILATFIFSMTAGDILRANAAYAVELPMPAVNRLVHLSEKYDEPTLRGVQVDPADPFKLTFVYDKGSEGTIDEKTATELAQYFFAALVTPTKDLWVNLSPFEKDRVIEDTVAQTEIGDVFLAQDYMLKQLSASLTDPATDAGKAYWSAMAATSTSTSSVSHSATGNAVPGPVEGSASSMNKIWITPGEIKVYSDSTNTIIADAKLDVHTEHDYFAGKSVGGLVGEKNLSPAAASVQAVRDVVLPLVRKDVNEGKNFSRLRQMMHAIILAQLFKSKYGASVYGALIDTGKDQGLAKGDPAMKSNVFEKYVASFNNGVYRTTVKTRDARGKKIKREYFSGGVSSALRPHKVKKVLLAELRKGLTLCVCLFVVRADHRKVIAPDPDYVSARRTAVIEDSTSLAVARADLLNGVDPAIARRDSLMMSALRHVDDARSLSLVLTSLIDADRRKTVELDNHYDEVYAAVGRVLPGFFRENTRRKIVTAVYLNDKKTVQDVLGFSVSSSLAVQGGIDLSGIVGMIELEGTGDPWNGQRLSSSAIGDIVGVSIKAERGIKPFVLTIAVVK